MCTYIPVIITPIGDFLVQNWWIFIMCSVLSIMLFCAILCFKKLSRKVPLNYILLIVFTLLETVTVMSIAALAGSPVPVALAMTVTLVLFICLTTIGCFVRIFLPNQDRLRSNLLSGAM